MRARASAVLALAVVAAAAAPASVRAQAAGGGGAVAVQIQELEAEIRRLNGRIERLEFLLRRVAEDGGLRLSDLDFRVTELEGGDISLLGPPTPLGETPGAAAGGGTAGGGGGIAAPVGGSEADRAVLEDARGRLSAGDPAGARDLLKELLAEAPQGPLAPEAGHWLGMAEWQLGDVRAAAQAFLSNVVSFPDGPRAPESLLMLGRSLSRMGRPEEACSTFRELTTRHPDTDAAAEATVERTTLGCG